MRGLAADVPLRASLACDRHQVEAKGAQLAVVGACLLVQVRIVTLGG